MISNATMAVLDLENIALGAQEAHYPAFDIKKVVERLLLKGHIVVKKACCDFERYEDFKRGLHETAFELIEIPYLRQSGRNSADFRMVVASCCLPPRPRPASRLSMGGPDWSSFTYIQSDSWIGL